MLRDAVKLGVITAVGLGVVATVGVGVGIVTLVAGAIFAGLTEQTSEPATKSLNDPKMEENKTQKQKPPVEKRSSSETTKKQVTTKAVTDLKSDKPLENKPSIPNGRDEVGIGLKIDRAFESKSNVTPNGKDNRKPPPNKRRSSSVLVNKPVESAASSPSSKDVVSRAGQNNEIALLGDKPSSVSRELEPQVAPEVTELRIERASIQDLRKRGAALGPGGNEKRPSRAQQAKTEAESVPEPLATPGPMPLLPPSPIPIPKPKSNSNPTESPGKLEATSEPTNERESLPAKNDPQESRRDTQIPQQEPFGQSHSDKLPSFGPLVSASLELAAVAIETDTTTPTTSSLKLEPLRSNINNISYPVAGVLQGPASASRDSFGTVQRKNSKLTSAAKKVSHSVKKVFRGPDGKVIRADQHKLTSSSSDSVDSQRFDGGAFSKLASSSRESVASTKSRRSLIDGTKNGFKRMFRGSSDNITVPPVPILPNLASSETPGVSDNKPAAPKPTMSVSAKDATPAGQETRALVSNTPSSITRNAPGSPEPGNNASPLLKGMFKGRTQRGKR